MEGEQTARPGDAQRVVERICHCRGASDRDALGRVLRCYRGQVDVGLRVVVATRTTPIQQQTARYPQEMPWFQEFAGIAFMWQDGPTEPDVRTTPFFALVPPDEPAGDVVEFTLSGG